MLSCPINTSAIIILALYTVIWGLWLISPFWATFDHAPLYSFLASIMSEFYWGGIAVACGGVMTAGVLKSSYESLIRGAFIGFVHWLVISIGYFIGDWHNTGGITALTIAIYCGFIYLNLKVNRDNMTLSESGLK